MKIRVNPKVDVQIAYRGIVYFIFEILASRYIKTELQEAIDKSGTEDILSIEE